METFLGSESSPLLLCRSTDASPPRLYSADRLRDFALLFKVSRFFRDRDVDMAMLEDLGEALSEATRYEQRVEP